MSIRNIAVISCAVLFFFMLVSFNTGEHGSDVNSNTVVLQFITHNGFGNNLYIDNVSVGSRFDIDAAPTSIRNIPVDTNYSYYGTSSFKLVPSAGITNTGKSNITTPFNVTLKVTPGNYSSTKTITSLNRSMTTDVTFDSLNLIPGLGFNIILFTSLANDLNRSNDTIRQYTYFLPGARRNVLFESYTNTNCGPCAFVNPPLDSFITARFDSIVAIKYHVYWPLPSTDPMYLANPEQNNDRTVYYGISLVPVLLVDGKYRIVSGYNTPSNLEVPFYSRLALGSPLSVTVTDTRIPGDSIKANVSVRIYSPLLPGNYYLRVHAIERVITYPTPPGTNGETIFYDTFRRAFPNSQGTQIPLSPGQYNYEFRYKRDTLWVDSMIYTAAFVQNDANKEVINSGKARHYASMYSHSQPVSKNYIFTKPAPIPGGDRVQPGIVKSNDIKVDNGFLAELFEWYFPPTGWTIVNPDSGITFSVYNGISGPSFGGTRCIKMDFFNYESLGQIDYLISPKYYNVQESDSIKFDWAYAQFPYYNDDRLEVKVSTDGGATFPFTIFDRSGPALATAPLTTVGFVPASDSEWGTFSTTLGNIISVKPISNSVPTEFKLYQNYPNPFNPSTKIRFSLPFPSKGGVTLVIYDMLGREVANLIPPLWGGQEGLQPGTYEVVFDSGVNGQLPASGVYFYKLTAGSFSDTKKMVLLK